MASVLSRLTGRLAAFTPARAAGWMILATLLPAYLLAAAGLVLRRPRLAGARMLIPGLCGLRAIVVALAFAGRDSRRSLPVVPFAFVFAAAGLVRPTGAPDP